VKATTPSSNTDFWSRKFQQNVERDNRNVETLLAEGWKVGIVWECAIGKQPSVDLLDEIECFLADEKKVLKHFE
tara:strand:- start:365 stop:586 length:222 start_codon:yes stop_codon:yes gene_type:complete